MGNGLMEPHAVEAAFFRVGNHALVVFQSAGDRGLAVSFKDRHIYHIVHGQGCVAHLDRHAVGIMGVTAALLQVYKGDVIPVADAAQEPSMMVMSQKPCSCRYSIVPARSSPWVVAPREGSLAQTRLGFRAIFFFLSPISSARFAASKSSFVNSLYLVPWMM